MITGLIALFLFDSPFSLLGHLHLLPLPSLLCLSLWISLGPGCREHLGNGLLARLASPLLTPPLLLLFQILKDDAVKVLHSICQQIWKTQQWPQGWKRSGFIPIPKKGNAKECSNYLTNALISHASKVKLKISKPGFSNTWTVNFQMFKLVLEKAEETEIKLPTFTRSVKKQESSKTISISALLTMPKVFDCVDHNKLENSEKDGNARPPDLPLKKSVCRSGSNS